VYFVHCIGHTALKRFKSDHFSCSDYNGFNDFIVCERGFGLFKGELGELEFYFRKIPLHQQNFLVISVLSVLEMENYGNSQWSQGLTAPIKEPAIIPYLNKV